MYSRIQYLSVCKKFFFLKKNVGKKNNAKKCSRFDILKNADLDMIK